MPYHDREKFLRDNLNRQYLVFIIFIYLIGLGQLGLGQLGLGQLELGQVDLGYSEEYINTLD